MPQCWPLWPRSVFSIVKYSQCESAFDNTVTFQSTFCATMNDGRSNIIASSITACTVVQAVVKATSQSNGKGQILTPWGSETPEKISMKLGIYNRVAGMTTHANPCGAATTWVVWANTWKNTCCGFLGIPFFYFILRLAPSAHTWSDFDDLYVIRRVSAQGCAFWGSRSYCFSFGGKIAKNPYFGAWIGIFKFYV